MVVVGFAVGAGAAVEVVGVDFVVVTVAAGCEVGVDGWVVVGSESYFLISSSGSFLSVSPGLTTNG